jgi:hypothetical protein
MGLSFISVSLTESLEGTSNKVAELYVSPFAGSLKDTYSQHLSSQYQNNGFQLDIVGECMYSSRVGNTLHRPGLTWEQASWLSLEKAPSIL